MIYNGVKVRQLLVKDSQVVKNNLMANSQK